MPLLVVAVGVAAYWNSFAGVFIFDDEHAIVRNRDSNLRSGLDSALWSH
jgi:hypothetical protein